MGPLAATMALTAAMLAAQAPQAADSSNLNDRLAGSAVARLGSRAVKTPNGPYVSPQILLRNAPPSRKCAVPLLRVPIPEHFDTAMVIKPPDVAVPMPQVTVPAPSCDPQADVRRLTLAPRRP